jgi:hypothetical protein
VLSGGEAGAGQIAFGVLHRGQFTWLVAVEYASRSAVVAVSDRESAARVLPNWGRAAEPGSELMGVPARAPFTEPVRLRRSGVLVAEGGPHPPGRGTRAGQAGLANQHQGGSAARSVMVLVRAIAELLSI